VGVCELAREREVEVRDEDVPALGEEGGCEGAGNAGCAAWVNIRWFLDGHGKGGQRSTGDVCGFWPAHCLDFRIMGLKTYGMGVNGFHIEGIVGGSTKHLYKLRELPRSG
jgi:hypothetical protein